MVTPIGKQQYYYFGDYDDRTRVSPKYYIRIKDNEEGEILSSI
jgi:hypothetical protein